MLDSKQERQHEKDTRLGISPITYGLGVASKYMLLTVTTVAATLTGLTLAFTKPGEKGWRNRDNVVDLIEKPKKWVDQGLNGNKERFKGVGAILAASAMLGVLVSHIIQVPALIRGRQAAKHAADKYDAVLDENEKLRQSSATGGNTLTADVNLDSGSPKFAAGMTPQTSHVAAEQQRRDAPPLTGIGV